jgi:hypothetical protein
LLERKPLSALVVAFQLRFRALVEFARALGVGQHLRALRLLLCPAAQSFGFSRFGE